MKHFYFDNAATTKPSKNVLDLLVKLSEENYGNPSSMHDLGLLAEQGIKKASKDIASIINCGYEELFYTSGGTESNNLAILGTADSTRNKHFITDTTEHSSVLNCYKKLESNGCDVTYLPASEDGTVDLDSLRESIRENTALVSIMHVNNITGAVQDIEAIGKLIHSANPGTVFHVDAVQSFCKHEMNVKKSGIDLLSMSSHKIHGMKGVGALYINGKPKISPLFFGGGQQRNIRPGTENSLGIMTFAAAAKEFYAKINENKAAAARIKNLIISGLSGAVINSPENASPYILNISFPGIMAEVLLHALEEVGIFVSAGAACSARIKNHSVLTAYGKPAEIAESSIRLSFSHENTIDEAAYFIEKINEIVPKLKR